MDGIREESNTNDRPQNRQSEGRREKLELAREITQLFSLERYAYITCSGIAVVLLIINAISIMYRGDVKPAELGLLFGASGLITISIGRLIYMWNKLVDLIISEVAGRGENRNAS